MAAAVSALADHYEDLVEDLAGDEPDWEAAPDAPGDLDEINRRLRRLARVRADMTSIEELAEAEAQRVQEWADRRSAPLIAQERWLVESIELYHRSVLAREPDRKTISLPCGTLKARAQQPEWEYSDEAAFMAWACKNGRADLVRIPPAPDPVPDKAAVKKVLRAEGVPGDTVHAISPDGEVVPGVTVTVRGPKFTVDVDEVGAS